MIGRHNQNAIRYEVLYRFENGDFKKIDTLASEIEIFNSSAGQYEIRVFRF